MTGGLIPLLERSIQLVKAKRGEVTIGASQISAVIGLSPHYSAEQLFDELTGRTPREPPNEQMKRGLHLEPGLCSWWCDIAGAERREAHYASHGVVLGNGQLQVFHPAHPWIRATPDIVAHAAPFGTDKPVLMVCDTKSPRSDGKKVGEAWVKIWDEAKQVAPDMYRCQVQFQMGVLRAAGVPVECGELAAGPVWGNLLRIGVSFDAEFFADMVAAADRFYACVLANELTDEFKTKEQQ